MLYSGWLWKAFTVRETYVAEQADFAWGLFNLWCEDLINDRSTRGHLQFLALWLPSTTQPPHLQVVFMALSETCFGLVP